MKNKTQEEYLTRLAKYLEKPTYAKLLRETVSENTAKLIEEGVREAKPQKEGG